MSLKNKFLKYCELQRSAQNYREVHGTDDPRTVDAYQRANEIKREVLNLIDKYEPELDPADRDWYYDGDGTKRMKNENI